MGEQTVKNIARPIGVHRVQISELAAPAMTGTTNADAAIFGRASIAVLPFVNMSGDPEQEYFADGIVEEIITALSHMRWLSVIARNSSFTYKGKNVDVKLVGRELGVRYVLEGSVRKSGNRLRITGQLIDAASGTHLWADRFDGGLEDIFDLQDHVTASVVGTIAPKLEQAEIERAKRKPTESLDAYDYFLRGMASLHQWTKESNDEALRLFYKSIELDPGFASAYGMAAWSFVWRKVNGWMGERETEIEEAGRLARRAVDLGADDAVALSGGGYALVFVAHDVNRGAAYIDRALALNPNLAWALHSSGWTKAFLGEPDAAIKLLTHAMRLNPLDPLSFRAQGGIAFAHFLAGRYDEAALWAEKALRERPNYPAAIRELAAANALAGRLAEAQKAMAHLREVDPGRRVSTVKDWVPLRRPDDLARLEQGLRIAGLPE
jgi:TolB-like protein